jgi:hypothetical protein
MQFFSSAPRSGEVPGQPVLPVFDDAHRLPVSFFEVENFYPLVF